MGWANPLNITTTHLDSASDDPSQARAEILAAVEELQAVVAGRNTTNGVAPLDNNGLVPAENLPATLTTSSENLVLDPSTGVVGIDYLLNITAKTTAELTALTPIPNMVALCSDGDAGQPCLAVYTGDNDGISGAPIWYRISLGAEIATS